MEIDASLTRNDFFPAGGDNFSFNTTLFRMFEPSTGGIFDVATISKYRYERWHQCKNENPQFYFPILGFFQYGAASFLYELWPNGNEGYVPNLHNTATLYVFVPCPHTSATKTLLTTLALGLKNSLTAATFACPSASHPTGSTAKLATSSRTSPPKSSKCIASTR